MNLSEITEEEDSISEELSRSEDPVHVPLSKTTPTVPPDDGPTIVSQTQEDDVEDDSYPPSDA